MDFSHHSITTQIRVVEVLPPPEFGDSRTVKGLLGYLADYGGFDVIIIIH